MYIDDLTILIENYGGKILNFVGEPVPKTNKVAPYSNAFPFVGVYFFFDSELNLMYIGASRLMRYRIREHLGGSSNTKWISDRFAFAGFVKCESEQEAFEFEKHLIHAIQPIGNKTGAKSLHNPLWCYP